MPSIRLCVVVTIMNATALFAQRCSAFGLSRRAVVPTCRFSKIMSSSSSSSSSSSETSRRVATDPNSESGITTTTTASADETLQRPGSVTPWNDPRLEERAESSANALKFRSRQHVNPLARKFQQPTVLSDDWPRDVYRDLGKPLFLDIGCSRGGFLVEMAKKHPDEYNYLGLEIRPIVVRHAQSRVAKHGLEGRLDFVGCNANVDLERLLSLFSDAGHQQDGVLGGTNLRMVAIQFPDPHFKARHAKRRVVTPSLIQSLARFMPSGGTVFLQSDIQPVLDDMRMSFREFGNAFFQDSLESTENYVEGNLFGVPTEREESVLERGLPVYRAIFTRTEQPVQDDH